MYDKRMRVFWKTLNLALLLVGQTSAFIPISTSASKSYVSLQMEATGDRRSFINKLSLLVPASVASCVKPAEAKVFFDPAVYGDQELRQAAVNSLKEAVRRAVLQDPNLAPSFYQLAILDGLSYNAASNDFGPDGRVVTAVLSSKDESQYMKNLQSASKVLIQATKDLKKYTSVGIADAVALGGAGAIESVGGPFVSVQLGRTDAPKNSKLSPLNLQLLSGTASSSQIFAAFRDSGLTERELTALLGSLLTINTVKKTRSADDWKQSAKPKFREAGKMGRASEFKALSAEDIAAMEDKEFEDDPDDGWYIADTFGSRNEAFGKRVGDDMSEKNFNKFMKDLYSKRRGDISEYGWIGKILIDKQNPTTEQWVSKYAGSYLSYNKDLSVAYNSITQLGVEYTGGKYESLLNNKKRKTLKDDDLGIF